MPAATQTVTPTFYNNPLPYSLDPSKHDADCRFRLASTCRIPVECEHGYDTCPFCDPCSCHPVPPITEPLGRYWDHPPRESIVIDDTHALMDRKTFKALAAYSLSDPSGVYEGKMWKSERTVRAIGEHGPYLKGTGGWYLRWFGRSAEPGYVSNNARVILLVD